MTRSGVNSLDPIIGQLQPGTVVGFDPQTNTLLVQLNNAPSVKGNKPIPVSVPTSHTMAEGNGLFIGSLPSKNTPIIVGQGPGNQYYFVSYKPENLSIIPDLNLGELTIHSSDTSIITLDTDSNINIGSPSNGIHVFASSQKFPRNNLITLNLENENHFTQGYREVGGIVKRDIKPNPQAASWTGDSKLEDDNYDVWLFPIGLDPKYSVNYDRVGPTKNPPFSEHREIIYEFMYNSEIDDDLSESKKYTSNTEIPPVFTTPNRRKSRSDTLSLSLVSPNYLMEEVKGTVVDVFGNILDLNRVPVAVGSDPSTSLNPQKSTDQQQSFLNIRAAERKSVAYHFEVNARKDPNPSNQGTHLAITDDNYNAKLQRSRFFFDIDKEGQFKLNVPSSSETGNIPLLARYENYSTFGTEDNGNPNKSWHRDDNLDIFLDSFASPQYTLDSSGGRIPTPDHGSIVLKNGDADAGPIDRLTQTHIRHGIPFHDILQTCSLHQNNQTINYNAGTDPNPLDISYIENLSDLVETTIKVGGPGANAGGRSGSISLDGSLEFSIGANSIDRQSLWLDTAGGMVCNIGRDRNLRSAVMNMDGDVFIQIDGFGVSGDARFEQSAFNGQWAGTLDLRVASDGYCHMFRIDPVGITIMSPGYIAVQSSQGIKISSDSDIQIDAETLTLNGRMVLKEGASI